MRRGFLYYFLLLMGVLFLVITLVGGWYLVVNQGSLPNWTGSVVAAYTGGVFGILGMFVRDWLAQQNEKRKQRELMRYNQIQQMCAFLRNLRSAVHRLFVFLSEKERGNLLRGIAPQEEEVRELRLQYYESRNNALVLDADDQELLDEVISHGLDFLEERMISLEDLALWNDKCEALLVRMENAYH